MKIVLSGVESRNKGAELMIYAILQEIEKRAPKSTVYFDIDSIPQGLSYIKTNLFLKEKPVEKYRRLWRRLHISGIFRVLHLGLPVEKLFDDIYPIKGADFFMDASGFHFSDQWHWPEERIQSKKKLWNAQKKVGSKIVFLPQAFGPFNENYSRQHLSNMAEVADLIFARDNVSYGYLETSGLVNMKKVYISPDFTSLVHGVFPAGYEHLKNAVCVIPNCRMLDKNNLSYEDYLRFLSLTIDTCKKGNNYVYLLNHEGKGDEELAYRIKSAVSGEIEVVTGLNALEVKGLISSARLVITSRFHGAVSSLNSGVPCLATSWSHKYEELFSDYDMHNCVLNVKDEDDACMKVSMFLRDEQNKKIRKHLSEILPSIKARTEEMWNIVWNN